MWSKRKGRKIELKKRKVDNVEGKGNVINKKEEEG